MKALHTSVRAITNSFHETPPASHVDRNGRVYIVLLCVTSGDAPIVLVAQAIYANCNVFCYICNSGGQKGSDPFRRNNRLILRGCGLVCVPHIIGSVESYFKLIESFFFIHKIAQIPPMNIVGECDTFIENVRF